MIEPLLTALIGALIGGACSFGAVYWQNRAADKADERAQIREIHGFLRAALTELSVLDDKFNITVGRMLDAVPPGEALRAGYELSQDYFVVFNRNAHLLGRVDD